MTPEERIADITRCLEALSGWTYVTAELQALITQHTTSLVEADNEQTRGRIKALTAVIELPQTLRDERDGISAGLSEQDPADLS